MSASLVFAISPSENKIRFDLPEQPLSSALIEFALQANVTVLVDNNLVAGLRSKTISGNQLVGAALNGLISGANLEYQYDSQAKAYVIQIKRNDNSVVNSTTVPASQSFVDQEIEEVIVRGVRFPLRYNTLAHTQLRGGMNYFDSARFINVLPQRLIEDQKAGEIGDLLKYASGITPGDGVSDSNDDVFIRGFRRHAIYVDGFRLSDSTGVKMHPQMIDRVEIIKGPSTLLFGQAEPGGIVDVVRKRPLSDNFIAAEYAAGTLGKKSSHLDLNFQAPTASELNVRLILANDNQDTSGEVSDIRKELISPSLTWHLSDSTKINFDSQHQYATQVWNRGFQVLGPFQNVFSGVTLEQASKVARPDFSTHFNLYSVELGHSFSSEWNLRVKYFKQDEQRLGIRTDTETLLKSDLLFKKNELGKSFILLIPGGTETVPIVFSQASPERLFSIGKIRNLYDESASDNASNLNANLDGTVELCGYRHRLIVGGEWHRQEILKDYTIEVRHPFPSQFWPVSKFNSLVPQISEAIVNSSRAVGDLVADKQRLLYDDYGFYFQDSIDINHYWIASAGTRYTKTTGQYLDITNWAVSNLEAYRKFSSQVGLVFKPIDSVSYFMNYSEALRANYHIDDLGSRIPEPETSDQFEVGVKSLLLDGRFLSSLAFFNIHKKNITDLNVIDGVRTSLLGHQQNASGVDFDFSWQYSSKWNFIGAASVLDSRIVSGANKGKRPALVANKTLSFFVNYQITDALYCSGGMKYVSERLGYSESLPSLGFDLSIDTQKEYRLPSYSTLELGLSYKLNSFLAKPTLQLSAKNVLDNRYYTAILGPVRTNVTEGRSVVGSLKVEF